MVKLSEALLTLNVRVAAIDIARLIVLEAAAFVSLRFPAASVMEFPASVYPLPEIVIELKLLPAPMLLFVDRFAAPAGKNKSLPPAGAAPPVPDQLPPVAQLPLVAPVQVAVTACAVCTPTNAIAIGTIANASAKRRVRRISGPSRGGDRSNSSLSRRRLAGSARTPRRDRARR